MDLSVFVAVMGGSISEARYKALLAPFEAALLQAKCTTPERVAMFVAQVGTESAGLRYTEEIASGAAYEGRKDLGNVKPGDGRRFKGRGPIQITGRENYTKLSAWAFGQGLVPTKTYFVDNPTHLAWDRYLFLGPVWYWTVARDMNALADKKDINGATRAVNGGTNGLRDRTFRWNRALKYGKALLPSGSGEGLKAFPLPRGEWYGRNDGTNRSHSGARALDRTNIARLQRELGVAADGIFGRGTEAAVKAKQKSKKLAVDGKVGPMTWKAVIG